MLKKENPNLDTTHRFPSERDRIADALSLFADKGPKNEAQPDTRPSKCGHPQATPNAPKEPRPLKKSNRTYLDSPPADPNPRTANKRKDDESIEYLGEPELDPNKKFPDKPKENILNHRSLFD